MKKIIPLLLLFAGCRSVDHSTSITSMQTVDRNGFCETISNKDRLKIYQNVNFLSSQPYEKVLRVYGKNEEGKSRSKITSYHTNGSNWQYLEALDGRANGVYLEWHENGKLKIEGRVIEGVADLTENAQKSWLFDGECNVWTEEGDLQAEFFYSRGHLENEAKYYFQNGSLKKIIPYKHGLIEGTLTGFDPDENILEEINYVADRKDGPATARWSMKQPKYQEQYRDGSLIHAIYFDPNGEIISEIEDGEGFQAEFQGPTLYSLVEYKSGLPEGEVKLFDSRGQIRRTYQIHDGMKSGEEWEYYVSEGDDLKPHLLVTWFEDQIQGMTKTWYENGALESQREMSSNKKHGHSFSYYKTGELMILEVYENDRLIDGSYYKKGEQTPISTIENGDGTATLFNPEGHFLKKITYERFRPIVD